MVLIVSYFVCDVHVASRQQLEELMSEPGTRGTQETLLDSGINDIPIAHATHHTLALFAWRGLLPGLFLIKRLKCQLDMEASQALARLATLTAACARGPSLPLSLSLITPESCSRIRCLG
jgi:hypothetical protein